MGFNTGWWIAGNGVIVGPHGPTAFAVSANGMVTKNGMQTKWRFVGNSLAENGMQTQFARSGHQIVSSMGGATPPWES